MSERESRVNDAGVDETNARGKLCEWVRSKKRIAVKCVRESRSSSSSIERTSGSVTRGQAE